MLIKLNRNATIKAPSPFDPGTEEFLSVDVERLGRRLEIDDRAKQRGSSNLPPENQQHPDDVELSIESEISNIARQAHATLTDYLKTYLERSGTILASDSPDKIRSIASTATTGMFAQVRTGSGILFNSKRDFVQANADIENFKIKRNLTRPASYPESRFLHVSVLLLLLVLESGANAVLIGDASEFGILGGFMEMIGISFINLVAGFSLGCFVLPQVSRRFLPARIAFIIISLAVIALILLFNLFVGHYRDVIAVSASDLGIVNFGARAVENLRAAPLGLADFKSWIFMILGTIFSGIAVVDGLKWDDLYPGYGSRDRSHKALVLRYGRDFERLQNGLERLAKKGIDDINEIADRAGRHEQELNSISSRLAGLKEKLAAYYAQLERDGRQLIQRYRQVNIGARASAPPAYFNNQFQIPDQDRRFPNTDMTDRLDAEALKAAARQARRQVENMHRELLDVYKTIDQLSEQEVQNASPEIFAKKVEELVLEVRETDDRTSDFGEKSK
ncbi:hypothetical protein [Oceanibacterium hippocampi]|nr:hypothetical protein [Oceanibacterium hippocampi]